MANGNRKKLKIHWKAHKKNHEYIDLIPYEWFEHDVDGEDKRYSITDLRERYVTKARCKISVSGNQATLYYGGSNKKHNKRKGIWIGTTQVTFRGENRSGVRKVEWEDEHNFIDFFIFFIKYIFYIHNFLYEYAGTILVGNRRSKWTRAARTKKVRTIPRAGCLVYRPNKTVARGAGRDADRCGDRLVVR